MLPRRPRTAAIGQEIEFLHGKPLKAVRWVVAALLVKLGQATQKPATKRDNGDSEASVLSFLPLCRHS